MYELLLKGGDVVDPSQGLRKRLDIAVSGTEISELAPDIDPASASRVLDVSDKLVLPGLIDLHSHIYEAVNQTGVNPDLAGVQSGVTTLVDAGSAGCYNFGGFPQFVAPAARTRIVCMLHISRTGLAYQPEITGADSIDYEETLRVVEANKPLVKGVKVRAIGPAVPTLGIEMVRLARRAAEEAGVRLMVHIGDKGIDDGPTLTRDALNLLRQGDILTHLFTPNAGKVLDNSGKVLPELMEAQERGVFLDTAFGRYNFSFDVARRAMDQGVKPQSISTDVTVPGRRNTVHSLTEMLSRFMAMGFDLEDVVRMATANPARALGMEDSLGSLAVGREADISVLESVAGDWVFHDTAGESLNGDTALVPAVTIRAGDVVSPDWGPRPWGWLPDSR